MMGMSTKYEHEDETYVVNDTSQKQKFQNSCLARLHCTACLGNVVKICGVQRDLSEFSSVAQLHSAPSRDTVRLWQAGS